MLDASDGLRFLFCFSIRFVVSRPVGTTMRCLPMLNCLVLSREWGNGLIMETTIGDYTAPNIGTTIGIHSLLSTRQSILIPWQAFMTRVTTPVGQVVTFVLFAALAGMGSSVRKHESRAFKL